MKLLAQDNKASTNQEVEPPAMTLELPLLTLTSF